MGAFLLDRQLVHLENGVLGSLSDAELHDGFGWNLNGGTRQWVAALASGTMLFHQLAQSWEGHFTGGLHFAVSEGGQNIPHGHYVLFAHVGLFSQCLHQLRLCHLCHTCFV